jgi:hypothetical protein
MFDPADNTTHHYLARIDSASDAVCNHPWITEIYKNTWIARNVWALDIDNTINNVLQFLGWVASCVNLDEEIMKELNGGDSSASSKTPQE